jgi:hypothetical protein
MAYDVLHGHTPGNWARQTEKASDAASVGAITQTPSTYTPIHWWTAKQAEAHVATLQKAGGVRGGPLLREQAEKETLEAMRANKIGLLSGGIGSWIISEKEQMRLLTKVDDIRYDIRLASKRVGIAMGCLAGALGMLGIASIYRTSKH